MCNETTRKDHFSEAAKKYFFSTCDGGLIHLSRGKGSGVFLVFVDFLNCANCNGTNGTESFSFQKVRDLTIFELMREIVGFFL